MYIKPGPACLMTMIVVACLCAPLLHASGARKNFPKDFSLGSTHSINGVGLCSDLWHDGETFSTLAFTADLIDILNGVSSTPGLKATFHYNFIFKSMKEGKYEIYAGPGIAAGHVRNTDNRFGAMAGISGDAGLRMRCNHSLVLSLEYQADFALIFKNRYNPDMGLYKTGFKYSYYPHIRILYTFR